MADIAQLVIAVDASQVGSAEAALTKLSLAGSKAEASVGGITGAVTALATSWAALQVYEAASTVVQLSMRYEMLGSTLTVMANNMNVSGASMRAYQQDLENTGISALSARKSLQVMAAAQVNLATAADLGRVAQDAAVIAGINSSEAFDKMIRGIATGETRILRHMGIMVNFKNTINEYAKANDRSVSSLNSRELAEIRLNAVLEEGVKRQGVYEAAMTTAGKQLLSMDRYVKNLQVALGESFTPAMNEIVFQLADAVKSATESIQKMIADGEMAVFASKIRAQVVELIDSIKWWSSAIADHIPLISTLVGVYASFKIGTWVAGMYAAAQATWIQARAATAAAVERARAAHAEAFAEMEVSVARAQAVRANLSQIAVGNMLAVQKSTLVRIELEEAMAVSILEKKVLALSAAQSAATASATAMGIAMNAMGGWIGVIIMAVGTLITLFSTLGETVDTSAKDSARAMSDAINQYGRDLVRLATIEAARGAGKRKPTEAELFKVEDVPVVRQGAAEILKLTGKLEKLKAELASSWTGGFFSDLSFQINKATVDLSHHESLYRNVYAAASEKNTEEEISENAARKEAEKRLNAEKADREQKEQKAGLLAAEKELLNLKYKQQDLELVGIGLSDKDLKISQDALKLERDLLVLEEKIKLAKGPAQAELIKQRKELPATALAQARADVRVAEQKKISEANKKEADSLDELTKELKKLKDINWEYGKSEKEISAYRNMSKNDISGLTEAQKELNQQMAEQREIQKANEEDKRLKSEAAKLNENKNGDMETALAHLNKLKSSGLDPVVYDRMYKAIMLKDLQFRAQLGDTFAILKLGAIDFADKGGDALADWMNKTNDLARTWKTLGDSMKKVIADILIDMQKMIIKQTMLNLIMGAMGWDSGGRNEGSALSVLLGMSSKPKPKAEGGPVSSGNTYLVGEKGPELFSPGISGSIIPNSALGGQTNNIQVVVNSDGQTQTKGGGSGDMKTLGQMIGAKVREVLVTEARPGGLLNPV
jgi:hypothetical protein